MDITIVFNLKDTKIGCPIVQALLGGQITSIANCVDTARWEISPVDCKPYIFTEEQLVRLIQHLGGQPEMARSMINRLKDHTEKKHENARI